MLNPAFANRSMNTSPIRAVDFYYQEFFWNRAIFAFE